ncbi:hypothetical protein DV737_g4199, partial [Chaetothyriales sp. CBS 132003]
MAANKTTLKPAAEKLSLAVRKNVRDEWEAKRPGFEQELSDLLGEPWTITTNPSLIYANVEDSAYQSRIGEVISWYIERLVDNVKQFVSKFGDDGKAELNSAITQHVVDLGPQDSTSFTYGGLVVENGVLRLVYAAPRSFAANTNSVSQDIAGALKTANAASDSGKAYNLVARNGVRDNYDSKVDEVREKIAWLVGVKEIKLAPHFEENAAALSKSKDSRDDWDRILGKATLDYFEGFADQLTRTGFANDDMLQEGFQEAITMNEIALRVVDKLEKGTYNEVVVKDGVAVLQTTPKYWWANVGDIGSNILDVL